MKKLKEAISSVKYCYSCGHPLHPRNRIYGYDENTGNPLIAVDYDCPNDKWFRLRSHPLTESEACANSMCGHY